MDTVGCKFDWIKQFTRKKLKLLSSKQIHAHTRSVNETCCPSISSYGNKMHETLCAGIKSDGADEDVIALFL